MVYVLKQEKIYRRLRSLLEQSDKIRLSITRQSYFFTELRKLKMLLAESKTISFDDFIAWLPERSAYRYELRDGEIIEMPKPRGKHSEIAGSIAGKIYLEITRLGLSYLLPRESIVKSIDAKSGYEPDVVVLDREMLAFDLLFS
jgi:hypothetical protein